VSDLKGLNGNHGEAAEYLLETGMAAIGALLSTITASNFEDAKGDIEGRLSRSPETLASLGAMVLAKLATAQQSSEPWRVHKALGSAAGTATSGWLSALGPDADEEELVALLNSGHELLALAGSVVVAYGVARRHPKKSVREAAERGIHAAENHCVVEGGPWVSELTELIADRPDLAERILAGVADRFGEPAEFLRRGLGLPGEPQTKKRTKPPASLLVALAVAERRNGAGS